MTEPGSTIRTRSVIGAAATVGLLALAAGASAIAAQNPAQGPAQTPGPVVVGLPYLNSDNQDPSDDGAVLVRSATGAVKALRAPDLGLPQLANFGAVVAVGDLNSDGRDDLAIGTPGPVGATEESGRVDLVFGATGGFGTGRSSISLTGPGDEEFGAAVALVRLKTSTSEPNPISELFIGAPGATVNGRRGAGAVHHYRIAADGTPSFATRFTQDSALPGGIMPGIEGAAEENDRFGSVLAPGYGQVIVGVPNESLGTAIYAGAINTLDLTASGRVFAGPAYTQSSKGVAGHPETLDQFGASISFGGYVVGAAGESVGKLRNAGMVQTFRRPSDGAYGLVPVRGYTQDSPGVPGAAEESDGFGTSVAFGRFLCDTGGSIAIGTPYESFGKIRAPGSVTVLPWDPPAQTPAGCTEARVLHQSVGGQPGGVPGVAEQDDYLGQTIGARAAAGAGPRRDTLLIAAPGERIGKDIQETGRITALFPGGTRVWGAPGDPHLAFLFSSAASSGPQFSQ